MVVLLVDAIEEILRNICGTFILSDVMSKAVKTVDLIKISMLDTTIHKPNLDLGFALRHNSGVLKTKGTISDTQIARFKEDGKNFLVNLANYIATKTPIQSYFARCTRSLSLIYMVEDPGACKSCLIVFYKSWSVLITSVQSFKRVQAAVFSFSANHCQSRQG